MGKKCSHGKPLTEPCLACEKLFSSDDRLRDMNAALKARVEELEGALKRLLDALNDDPRQVSSAVYREINVSEKALAATPAKEEET